MPDPTPTSAGAEPTTPVDPSGLRLSSPRVVRELLARHGLGADKGFGQNFLVDASTLAAIVRAAELSGDDEVWEVGTGLGTLSRELAERAAKVVTIELDRRLLPVLEETLAPYPQVELRLTDALKVDWTEAGPGAVFVANLPYNVGTAVLSRVLASGRFRRLVMLLQREVAERLAASPGTAAYGSLSLWVAHHGKVQVLRKVPPGAFLPPPKVTSAVVRIDVDPDARPDPSTFALVRDGFKHRRKTLKANLVAAGDDPAQVEAALAQMGLDPRVRAEAIDLATFRGLARLLR